MPPKPHVALNPGQSLGSVQHAPGDDPPTQTLEDAGQHVVALAQLSEQQLLPVLQLELFEPQAIEHCGELGPPAIPLQVHCHSELVVVPTAGVPTVQPYLTELSQTPGTGVTGVQPILSSPAGQPIESYCPDGQLPA